MLHLNLVKMYNEKIFKDLNLLGLNKDKIRDFYIKKSKDINLKSFYKKKINNEILNYEKTKKKYIMKRYFRFVKWYKNFKKKFKKLNISKKKEIILKGIKFKKI